jgi:hypothetical protein
MFDELRDLLNYVGRKADAQRQREAMIDLLLWTMYADKLLALPESDRIDEMSAEMEWDSPTPAPQYLQVAVARIRDVLDDEEKAAAEMDSIYERLGTDEMRRSAYAACRDLAKVDGEMADEELAFLNTVKQRFHLADIQ